MNAVKNLEKKLKKVKKHIKILSLSKGIEFKNENWNKWNCIFKKEGKKIENKKVSKKILKK